MTTPRQQLLVYVSAILTTLYEVSPDEPVAASSLYLALGMNMSDYTFVRDMLVDCKWATATPSTIKLTNEGKSKAIEINAALAK